MAWDITKYAVSLELKEPMLGTNPSNKSIWAEHIANKQRKALKKEGWEDAKIEAEIEATIAGIKENDDMDSGKTTFMADAEGYFVRDYFVKGFMKEAARAKKEYGPLKQLANKVGKYCFVRPVKLYIAKPDADLLMVERPLRAQTPQGERVCIARSLAVPAGTKLDFEIHILDDVIPKGCVETLLEYGEYCGLGQWRGSGAGSFTVLKFAAV